MIRNLPRSLGIAPLFVALASSAWAATVIVPVGVTLSGSDALFPAAHLIDGSGLEFPLSTGDPLPLVWNHRWKSPASDSWVSGAPGGFPSDWYASSASIPTFVFDLGQDTPLDAVHLWPYSGHSGADGTVQGNSARTLEFRFNTAADGNGSFAGPAVGVTLDHGPLSETAAGFALPRQDFSVGLQTARWIEMRITDNWYVAPGDGTTPDTHGHLIRGGDRVGLGEIRFSAVPEPRAYAWVAGLGLLGCAVVRNRSRRIPGPMAFRSTPPSADCRRARTSLPDSH